MDTRHKPDKPLTREDLVVCALIVVGAVSATLILIVGFGGL